MKSLMFADCLKALDNRDLDTAELLLKAIAAPLAEPAAVALARAIAARITQERAALFSTAAGTESAQTISPMAFPMSAARASAAGYVTSAGLDSRFETPPPNEGAKRSDVGDVASSNPAMAFTPGGNEFEFSLTQRDNAIPLPGVSLVAGCMNREENLLKVLPSWLATDAAEIIIVDWSSASALWPKLSRIGDPRLRVIRIEGEQHWIAAHALNVGLRFASHELVFRVDCDIQLMPDFLRLNRPQPGEFVRGFWRAGLERGGEGQQFIQGTFGAYKTDLREANYYDERILTYGWEDSELYLRLTHDAGLAGKQINPASLRHIEQAEELRIANQGVSRNRFLGKFEPTEFEGAKNKFYTSIAGNWGSFFPSQDYRISALENGLYRGVRTTQKPTRNADFDRLAEMLATRQLAVWASTLPEIGSVDEVGIDYANLLRDAHALNRSHDLAVGINRGTRIYFIRCEPGPCRNALRKTLQVLRSHYPAFSRHLVLTDARPAVSPTDPPPDQVENVLHAPSRLMDVLSVRAHSQQIGQLAELERLIESGDESAGELSISIRSLAADVIRKATQFSDRLAGNFETLPEPVSGACMVTSLYDEQNLIRLVEYLACVVENLRVFERVAIFYEASTGLLSSVLDELLRILAIAPGRLLMMPYQKRPTFEELFSVKTLFPSGTIIAVANADVAFDATFAKIKQVDLSRHVVVLSRRDISRDGRKASLIRIEHGVPNTFSADAWICATPFEPDFFLDYPIGTMHCDSFINHQVSTSKRYSVINPCLDIRVFHLHDERFNSSAEKQKRDFEEIKRSYNYERERNGGADPVKGVAWSTLASAAIVPKEIQYQHWIPKVLIFHMGRSASLTFGHLLVLHLLCDALRSADDIVIMVRLRETDLTGTIGTLLARYQSHFSQHNFLLDIDDEDFDPTRPSAEGTVRRTATFADVRGWAVGNALRDRMYEFLAWPAVNGAKFLRCELVGAMSGQATDNLLKELHRQQSAVLPALQEFFRGLPDYSPEKNLLVPFVVPLVSEGLNDESRPPNRGARPRVSFITSLFNGGGFLPCYLENVFYAAREAAGEVIIIDANADERDWPVVNEFLQHRPEARDYIQYVHLERDPGLYECWKIGIERARADLVTNANIDDRRCRHHTARLVKLLEAHPEYAGACGSISCVTADGTGDWYTLYDNQVWFYGEGIDEIGFGDLYRVDEHGEARSRDVMHCMPVWRKRLHQRYGYFDEATYGTSADWAFWLKCTKAGERLAFDEIAFGQYFLNPESHNRRNDPAGLKEKRIIRDLIGINQAGFTKQ